MLVEDLSSAAKAVMPVAPMNPPRRDLLKWMATSATGCVLSACGGGNVSRVANPSSGASTADPGTGAASTPAAASSPSTAPSLSMLANPSTGFATIHVAPDGADSASGSVGAPLQTIMAASAKAMPGDTILIHAGTYRERIDPVRGGNSAEHPITYAAAPRETVVITGSERITGWTLDRNSTWKVVIPNSYFGSFNPFVDCYYGSWLTNGDAGFHTGRVYVDDDYLVETTSLDAVRAVVSDPAARGLWHAVVDGDYVKGGSINCQWFKPSSGAEVPTEPPAARYASQPYDNGGGNMITAFVLLPSWLRYDDVDFGTGSSSITLSYASNSGAQSVVEFRLDSLDGTLLGSTTTSGHTGGWFTFQTVNLDITPTSGRHTVFVCFKGVGYDAGNTTLYAQFPGINPNQAQVEISKRQVVFFPSSHGINFVTVRGLTLRNAAPNWASPDSLQMAVIGPNWAKGWVIEDCEIYHSSTCGISLGKYGDGYDYMGTADSYNQAVARALTHGWNKDTVGSHIVRNNRVHHCGQTGIVGSLGCCFSSVTGNEVHDIYLEADRPTGYENAGIKFHGAIDVLIANNHVYNSQAGGIWLDWMAQGARVSGNLLHDNAYFGDLFYEMQFGPLLTDNNVLLSPASLLIDSIGLAFAHNLISGTNAIRNDTSRSVPYHEAHSTAIAGHHTVGTGDQRFYNNVVANSNFGNLNSSTRSCTLRGNVYTMGATASSYDVDAVTDPTTLGVMLRSGSDGWYLRLLESVTWRTGTHAPTRPLVNTALLGRPAISGEPYENRDASPISIATDYFGQNRNTANPFPGPFETLIYDTWTKVWPKP